MIFSTPPPRSCSTKIIFRNPPLLQNTHYVLEPHSSPLQSSPAIQDLQGQGLEIDVNQDVNVRFLLRRISYCITAGWQGSI